MTRWTYYNENDPRAAAWIRELIKEGLVGDGEVDERDIRDVLPADVAGFRRCHWFAGIAVWEYALNSAGYDSEAVTWTGSCPCQPFSAAGKRGGVDDERHLWPHWHWLIHQCRPEIVFGEQVASRDGLGWLDLVSADLEGTGYAGWAGDLCAAGFGAPHWRQRLWFVAERLADAGRPGNELGRETGDLERPAGEEQGEAQQRQRRGDADSYGRSTRQLGHADDAGSQGRGERGDGADQLAAGPGGMAGGVAEHPSYCRWFSVCHDPNRCEDPNACIYGGGGPPGWHWTDDDGWMADADLGAREQRGALAQGCDHRGDALEGAGLGGDGGADHPGPVNGFWRDADWLGCRDGKFRPVEPGTFPLVDGAPARVGRLRGYGNAIVAPQAAEIVRAVMEMRKQP